MDCISEHLWIPLKDIEIHELVGEGSFGAVHKGIWNGRGGGTLVAIKKVRAEERDTIDYLCKELNVMASLRFQNICQVHGGCVVSDMEVWLVLEYIEGGNLHDFLHSHSPIPLSLQLSLSLQATKALNYLHSGPAPLLHRDIKSLNFLMQGDKLLLTDFGLSQVKDTIPNDCTTIGTLRWAAPEVLLEYPHWSEKADIYGLGMVFYEIVAREIPYKDDRSFFTIEKKIKDNIRPAIPDECPQAFAEIINRCWDPVPAKRPSALEIISLLRSITDPPRFSSAVPSIEITSPRGLELGNRMQQATPRIRAESIIAMHRGARSEETQSTVTIKSRPRSTVCVSESSLHHSRELEYSPLHWAVESNDEVEVREVINNGADIEGKDIWGRSPLHLAASIGNIGVVISLLEAGADLESVTKLGETALYVASLFGNVKILKELVGRGANIEAVAKDGFTALSKAVSLGHVKIGRELLKMGAKQERVKGESLFHLAARSGHEDELLIELARWRKNVDERDERGETALHVAARHGRIETVRELIEMGANLNEKDERGDTPIIKAVKGGHGEVFKLLVERGAKVDKMLTTSIEEGNVEAVTMILEFGKVNLFARDRKGNTFLHIASERGNGEIVKLILQKEVIKVDETNNEGHTALHVAKERGNKEVEEILIEASGVCLVQ